MECCTTFSWLFALTGSRDRSSFDWGSEVDMIGLAGGHGSRSPHGPAPAPAGPALPVHSLAGSRSLRRASAFAVRMAQTLVAGAGLVKRFLPAGAAARSPRPGPRPPRRAPG